MGEFFWYLCLKVRKHESELARADGDFKHLKTLKKYDVVTNAAEWYYPEIDEARPGEFVFVIVKRDIENWLLSARKHFCFDEWDFSHSNFQSFGLRTYHDAHFRRVYENFYEQTEKYFKGRWEKDAILVEIDKIREDPILERAMLKKLASAAGVHPDSRIPLQFPHRNKRPMECQFPSSRVAKVNFSYVDPMCMKSCLQFESMSKTSLGNVSLTNNSPSRT